MKRNKNSIFQICDQNGNLCVEREAIENGFIDHYSNLWSDPSRKSYSDNLCSLSSDLPVISTEDRQNLVRKVSRNEIFKV